MAGVEFALIGHQDDWSKISSLFHSLREPGRGRVDIETLRELVGWIPPRTMARVTYHSAPSGASVSGVYIDTFITPEALERERAIGALSKVREAIRCAGREGARIAALGGFTSILLETQRPTPPEAGDPALTTGNTLTSSFILQGVARAAALLGRDLARSTVLVIGATGDIGSACVRALGPRCRRLLVSARNAARLRTHVDLARARGHRVDGDTDVARLLPEADIVIAVASLTAPGITLDLCRPGAIVCDAGYPRNLEAPRPGPEAPRVFWGGMGHVTGGWSSANALFDDVYAFPVPDVFHGCLLEAIVLAFESRFEPFSQGRGFITPERIDEIAALSARHGVVAAPLFNQQGLWPEEPALAGRA
jgi:fatty aldehyde-generating acyl-ACP reductase